MVSMVARGLVGSVTPRSPRLLRLTPGSTCLHWEGVVSTLIRKRSSIALVSLVALAIVALPSGAGAAAGDLDPSFGVGGKVVTDLGESESGDALVLQPNGKLVVGAATGRDFSLLRYLPDGSPDPVFDLDGTVTTDFGRDEWLGGLAFRPGQLVAADSSITPLPRKASSSSPRRFWPGRRSRSHATGSTEVSTRPST